MNELSALISAGPARTDRSEVGGRPTPRDAPGRGSEVADFATALLGAMASGRFSTARPTRPAFGTDGGSKQDGFVDPAHRGSEEHALSASPHETEGARDSRPASATGIIASNTAAAADLTAPDHQRMSGTWVDGMAVRQSVSEAEASAVRPDRAATRSVLVSPLTEVASQRIRRGLAESFPSRDAAAATQILSGAAMSVDAIVTGQEAASARLEAEPTVLAQEVASAETGAQAAVGGQEAPNAGAGVESAVRGQEAASPGVVAEPAVRGQEAASAGATAQVAVRAQEASGAGVAAESSVGGQEASSAGATAESAVRTQEEANVGVPRAPSASQEAVSTPDGRAADPPAIPASESLNAGDTTERPAFEQEVATGRDARAVEARTIPAGEAVFLTGSSELDTATRATNAGAASRSATVDAGASERVADPSSVPQSLVADAGMTSEGLGYTADPSSVDRDLANVHPQLASRVGRVIERMAAEYGRDVGVVEGLRSGERQEFLYEQGRSRPGPVVTWTRNSLHSQGNAVDLVVDGSWNDPAGYELLQQVARQEGLQTLGARDPGHVELPLGDVTTQLGVDRFEAARPRLMHALGSQGGVARVAQLAAVAQPAQAAQVAEVAAPATPGGTVRNESAAGTPETVAPSTVARATTGSESARTASAPPQLRPAHGVDASISPDVSTSKDIAGRSRAARLEDGPALEPAWARDAAGSGTSDGTQRVASHAAGTPGNAFASDTPTGVEATFRSADVTPADRVARAQELQAAAGQSSGRIRVHLDDADGMGTSIRLDLRGTALDASIDVSDPEVAARLRSRVSELHRALESRGLDAGLLQVQAGKPAGEAVAQHWATRPLDLIEGTVTSQSSNTAQDRQHEGRNAGRHNENASRRDAQPGDPNARDPQKEGSP